MCSVAGSGRGQAIHNGSKQYFSALESVLVPSYKLIPHLGNTWDHSSNFCCPLTPVVGRKVEIQYSDFLKIILEKVPSFPNSEFSSNLQSHVKHVDELLDLLCLYSVLLHEVAHVHVAQAQKFAFWTPLSIESEGDHSEIVPMNLLGSALLSCKNTSNCASDSICFL